MRHERGNLADVNAVDTVEESALEGRQAEVVDSDRLKEIGLALYGSHKVDKPLAVACVRCRGKCNRHSITRIIDGGA